MGAFIIKIGTPNSTMEETLLLLKQTVTLAITSRLVKFVSPPITGVRLPPTLFFDTYYYFLRNRALMDRNFIKNDGVILHHFFNLTSTHHKNMKTSFVNSLLQTSLKFLLLLQQLVMHKKNQ